MAIRRITGAALLGFLLAAGSVVLVRATSPWPPDAQSTTGPTPPPGVAVAGLGPASPAAVTIPGVPAYLWQHGCGPTAAGMVIGYWDGHGFDALVPGDAGTQTAAVDEMIASEGTASNYTDYCEPIDSSPNLLPDKSEPPPGDEHPDECLADFMRTSQSAVWNYYGWSWLDDVGPALVDYVHWVGRSDYRATTANLSMGYDLTWNSFRAEIDAGRPLVFLVDTNGDGETDHFVPAVGYDTVAGINRYAAYNTWDTQLHWYVFRAMGTGWPWGIYAAVTFKLQQVVRLTGATVAGPTSGLMQTRQPFTATVSPLSATQPITYRWQATGLSPLTHIGGLTDTASFIWTTAGRKVVTVTASNDGGTVTAAHELFVTTTPVSPTAVTVTGPDQGLQRATYAFVAAVSPLSVTLPLTYVWQATGHAPVTRTGALSDTFTCSWTVTGTQAITTTVFNNWGSRTGSHPITVLEGHPLYLPLILKQGGALASPQLSSLKTRFPC